ncbi:MAG: hypothetical protein WA842_14630, partial [Croceibacterium sp.]
LAAALALAIREHAVPFVLLLGALALWRRDWREAAAWAALTLLFAAGMAWHLAEVSQHLLPTDHPSPSWLALRGLAGWTGNVVASSSLYLLPGWLAGRAAGLVATAGLGLVEKPTRPDCDPVSGRVRRAVHDRRAG